MYFLSSFACFVSFPGCFVASASFGNFEDVLSFNLPEIPSSPVLRAGWGIVGEVEVGTSQKLLRLKNKDSRAFHKPISETVGKFTITPAKKAHWVGFLAVINSVPLTAASFSQAGAANALAKFKTGR